MTMLDLSRKHDRATELRAIADGRLLLNVRNGVTVSRSMLAKIADELEAERAALAETKRELLEMEKSQMRLAAACGMATSRAEAALAEARKALEPFARRHDEAVRPDDGDNDGVTVKTKHLRTAHSLLNKEGRG